MNALWNLPKPTSSDVIKVLDEYTQNGRGRIGPVVADMIQQRGIEFTDDELSQIKQFAIRGMVNQAERGFFKELEYYGRILAAIRLRNDMTA